MFGDFDCPYMKNEWCTITIIYRQTATSIRQVM